MTHIHPTAVVNPRAELDPSVEVGPYAIVDEAVVVGPDCRIGPHVHLTGGTRIGAGNVFHTGCVIGDAPQDLKYGGEPTRLEIGEDNVFREHATVHRSNREEEVTRIGSHNLLMVGSHVGHNAVLGDHVIVANGALVAGHASIEDRAFLSGTCLVHQFARVGTLAFMQGGSGISKDLPPFTVATGANTIAGLNVVGLRRSGFSKEERLELRRVYALLFRDPRALSERIDAARAEFHAAPSRRLIEFVAASERGVCADSGRRR